MECTQIIIMQGLSVMKTCCRRAIDDNVSNLAKEDKISELSKTSLKAMDSAYTVQAVSIVK